MLATLTINNFVIVDRLELEFQRGLTVLTGETGAGKSIVVDAIGLLLGDRGDASVVRAGCERADLTAEFDLSRLPEARNWLKDNELEGDEECIVHRRIASDGRSRASVNGRPVPLRILKELGQKVIEIHGQHAHQRLTKRSGQRDLLDQFARSQSLCAVVAEAYQAWRETRAQLDAFDQDMQGDPEHIELLRHQVQELEALAPRKGELAQLDQEHRRLANAEKLIGVAGNALAVISGDDAVSDQLARLQIDLEQAASSDPALADSAAMFNDAVIQLQEAGQSLRHYLDALEADPNALRRADQRLNEIHDLARKHRVRPEELAKRLGTLQERLDQLANADERRAALLRVLESHERDWMSKAEALSTARKKAAQTLKRQVTQTLASLGMPDAVFQPKLLPISPMTPAPHGLDDITFLISTNAGQQPDALKKVASGGELSRVALALKVANISDEVPVTLVFDEVDAGIGGNTADSVGQRLRELGGRHQVLCVTHLAQVAANGHQHLAVSKQTDQGQTLASVSSVDAVARIEEVARMLGGEKTNKSMAHAKELINAAGR